MILDSIVVLIIKIFIAVYSLIPQNSISIGYEKFPTSFLPHQATTDSEKVVADLVFRKLFKYENGELINDLADSWSANPEFTEYKFKIKKNQKWQDGKPITSDDLLYSMTLYKSLKEALSIEKLSQDELVVKLKTPNSILPSILTFGVEPAHLKGQDQTSPIGSTSYRLARVIWEQKNISGVVLQSFQKNKTYSKITIRFYANENALFTASKLGEIEAYLSTQEVKWEGFEQRSINYLGRYYGIFLNMEKPKLQDQGVRETLSSSLNIDALLSTNYYQKSIMAQGPISNSPYTKDIFLSHTYDPESRLTNIQKNAVQNLNILLPNNQDGRQIETFLVESWEKKLGIKLIFEYLTLPELFDRAADGSFDAIFVGLETSADPDMYDFWHSSQVSNLNLSKFKDPRTDRALEEGRKSYSFETRKTHYDIFQDAISIKIPAIYIYHPGEYLYNSSKKLLPLPEKIYYPTDIVKNL